MQKPHKCQGLEDSDCDLSSTSWARVQREDVKGSLLRGRSVDWGPRMLLIWPVSCSLSRVRLFATPWTAACQVSLSITNSRSLLKLMSIESVMPSNHLILCHPLLLLPSIFPSIRVFSNESVLRIKWPKYWSFSFSISPSNEYSGWFPLALTGWISQSSVSPNCQMSPGGKNHRAPSSRPPNWEPLFKSNLTQEPYVCSI